MGRCIFSVSVVGEYVNLGHGKIERNGQGTHMFSNGMEYCGAWAKDKMSGSGKLPGIHRELLVKHPLTKPHALQLAPHSDCGNNTKSKLRRESI